MLSFVCVLLGFLLVLVSVFDFRTFYIPYNWRIIISLEYTLTACKFQTGELKHLQKIIGNVMTLNPWVLGCSAPNNGWCSILGPRVSEPQIFGLDNSWNPFSEHHLQSVFGCWEPLPSTGSVDYFLHLLTPFAISAAFLPLVSPSCSLEFFSCCCSDLLC